ncbi:hypothetical protein [Streptomyces scopuliridis]|uniref:hypothetical protein n=1 Tax=Streptomyces scopuliridis TaxID=452529 RepID=UPI003448D6FF
MANTPTRPPGRPRSERRKPKGPSTVALRPDDHARHQHLVAAAEFARQNGHADWAGAVDYVLSPLGPGFLARIQPEATGTSSLPIRMPKARKDAIIAAAEEEAKKIDPTGRTPHSEVITSIIEEAFAAWLDGSFELRLESKAGKGAGETLSVLNSRLNGALHAQVAAKCRDMKKDRFAAGRGVYVSTVASHALYEHFGIGPYAPDAETAG